MTKALFQDYFPAKYLTRPEIVTKYLPEFLDWALQIISKESKDRSDDICKMGALKSVAAIYKHGKREDLLKYAPTILKIVQESELHKNQNVVIQKMGVKMMQRLGLTFLKVNIYMSFLRDRFVNYFSSMGYLLRCRKNGDQCTARNVMVTSG